MRPPACDMTGRQETMLIRHILVFTKGIVNIEGHTHRMYYKLFPFWRIDNGE